MPCGFGKLWVLVLIVLAPVTGPSLALFSSPPDKIKLEELIARHLISIGSEKARASVKTRIISGSSQVVFHTVPVGQAAGRAVLASQGNKTLLGMSFPSPVYPREQLGFDGNGFMAAFVVPGTRSALGSFLMTHSLVFKQGLMGGTLSSAWPLLDLPSRKPDLEYAGLKTIETHLLHEVKYSPRGGSDLQIKIFFDQESFQHVRTEYDRIISAPTGDRSYVAGAETEIRYKMIEEFSDFRKEGELTLPHTYKIRLTTDTKNRSFSADWTITLTQFDFNQRIDPNSFTIAAN
ncbi:MAG TPA: hypothetical protein VLH87_04390 [Pyrinomonadaceae bacterium]|nr:hypothetical protein [Pyrinomonadaceae bacterium]